MRNIILLRLLDFKYYIIVPGFMQASNKAVYLRMSIEAQWPRHLDHDGSVFHDVLTGLLGVA